MGSATAHTDPQVINLNRILASQARQLLSSSSSPSSADPSIFKSRYERARIRANFDYARSLLLTVSSTKQLPKDDVQRKRDLVKRLQARLNELDQLYAHDEDEEDDEDEDSSDEESAQPNTTARVSESEGGMRQRNIAQASSPSQASSQPTATSTANRYSQIQPANTTTAASSSLQTRETTLSAHDSEKDTLQRSLLDLAVQLKQSVRGFGASMEAEKDTLDATVLGLDKSTGSMQGAGGKMKMLSRETEGAGWFRRMRLYAEVAGLWVLVVLLVFVFPKLRF